MTRPKANRTPPPAPRPAEPRADYADAFEIVIPESDVRGAEQAFRDGLAAEAGVLGRLVLRVHRHVLRFRLGPFASSDHAIGWRIVRSDHDEVVLTTDGPLMRGQLTLRRVDARATLVTELFFHRKTAARIVWAVVGPLHRALAPAVMEHSARKGVRRPVVRHPPRHGPPLRTRRRRQEP
jgi:hypothetical protein